MSGPFTLPTLPYSEDSLSPVISAQTVALHHGKHHAAYFNNLNTLVEGTALAELSLEEVVAKSAQDPALAKVFNNAGQAWNHILYWEQFSAQGARTPSGRLKTLIEDNFESLDGLKASFTAAAAGVFGSGWAWLVQKDNKLEIVGTSNADSPLAQGQHALLGVDVWEHAYYLDYQNRRPDHVKAVLDGLINWDYVGDRLK